ncbi:MAG: hypothetical protein ACRD12_02245 [Acidimicrobiales bacterium]
MTAAHLRIWRVAGWAVFALGALLLLLLAVDLRAPARPWLALALFAVGPGAAVTPHLGLHPPALAASVAMGISLVTTVLIAQGMVWFGVFSPVAAVALVLALMAAGLVAPIRSPQEVTV